MSFRRTVVVPSAKPPPPHLSQATVHNGTVYCSGALPIDPATGKVVEGTIGDRTVQCLRNLETVLVAAGSSLDQVLKVNIFVTSIQDVPKVNEAYVSVFKAPRPARACVEVSGLALGTDIEIECVGFVDQAKL